MAGENVILFEKYQAIYLMQKAREVFVEIAGQWFDEVVSRMAGKKPTLDEMTKVLFEMRYDLMGKMAEVLVTHMGDEVLNQQTMECPECGRILKSRGNVDRHVETMIGKLTLGRPYFYCITCSKGYYPADEFFELSEHRKQWDMQQREVELATDVPFARASELFEKMTGLSFSDHSTHEIAAEVANGLTAVEVSPTAGEIERIVDEIAKGKGRRPIVVLAIDGAHVPTRPEEAKAKRAGHTKERANRANWKGQWREAKGYRFYLIDNERIVHLISWHQVQTDEELEESLRQIKQAGLIPDAKVRLAVIADGAKWIWRVARELFPNARMVLDYYHCSEHLHKFASVQFAGDEENKAEWVESIVTRLFVNEAEGVIESLQKMETTNEDAKEELEKLVRYLINNRKRIDYGRNRKGGYPIGSGGIESANKYIGAIRLKRSGAWWYVGNANEMLALRCAIYNGTYEKVFSSYKTRALEAKRNHQP